MSIYGRLLSAYVVGGKPLVHDIELHDPPVSGRVVPVPGQGQPPAMEGGDLLALLALRGQSHSHTVLHSARQCRFCSLGNVIDIIPQLLIVGNRFPYSKAGTCGIIAETTIVPFRFFSSPWSGARQKMLTHDTINQMEARTMRTKYETHSSFRG